VTHMVSPNEFYVQRMDDQAQIKLLRDSVRNVAKAAQGFTIKSPKIGTE
jgi:hypothetical protein